MYRNLMRVFCALSLQAAIFGFVNTAVGETARAFFGSYQLTNVVEAGYNVDLTMTVRLDNPSMTDVRGGIVVIMDTEPHHSVLGSFSPITSLSHPGQITVTKSFTIPAAEYERWKVGHDPVLQFLVPGKGGTSIEGIQAHRLSKPGEVLN